MVATSQIPQFLGVGAVLAFGVSPEAKSIDHTLTLFNQSTARSISLCQKRDSLLKTLYDLLLECGEDDWDGYGAKSPTSLVVERAALFISKLPNDLARPDLIVMPNGDVGFDWDFAPRRTITVTIAESPRLAYAAIDGDEQWRGTASFTGEIPQRMIRAIRELAAKG